MAPAKVTKTASGTGTGGSLVRKLGPAAPILLAASSLLFPLHHPAPGAKGPVKTVAVPGAGGSASAAGNTLAGLNCGGTGKTACAQPYPLLAAGHPVDWFFVFKLNAQAFPGCAGGDTRTCPFGGTKQDSDKYAHFSQQFVYASSEAHTLQTGGNECLGTTEQDPVGATYDEIYNGSYHYVVWNDQPYGDPTKPCGVGDSCSSAWAHSKGMLAWNDAGEGMVMQVSTPEWPLSGSAKHARAAGGTLGCLEKDNDVEVSQHFFALRLTEPDLELVLAGLDNASIATDTTNLQVVNNGGPARVSALVSGLVTGPKGTGVVTGMLSTGVEMISKPGKLQVPPWQMVSAELGGVSLHVANWWTLPDIIPNTTASTPIHCWDSSLGPSGAVVSATAGVWNKTSFGLLGGSNPNGNHAKVGVSTSGPAPYVIFGDMNQEGSLNGPDCSPSQNGRGGTFYVMQDADLHTSVSGLLGATAN
ncbi:deoxyribonuclease II [Granulicella tundricola]|uniref:Deoxyribonuclease II n=1 Tax=Granulicella tundricola (strain ATCC BAA-1859 / DSM 23138 / MP5ACTX9) TaxID=1198114 RepID=E8X031_GRATM|nr:deoxyribonuclease II [Granulicella tundricola]ADW68927.1 deoxyribonuclease II [Granulicella tundricola MP5ACTX9]